MTLFRRLSLSLMLCSMLTSCIELEEKITINESGGGQYQLSLDMSQLSLLGGNGKMPMMEQIKAFPGIIAEGIKDVSGISDIKTAVDNPKGFFSVSFNFENHGAFKKAMLKLAGLKAGFVVPNYIKVKKHRIVKKDSGRIIKRMISSSESSPELMDPRFQQLIKVRTIIELPRPVKKVKNPKAVVRNGGKEVLIEGTLEQLFGGMDFGVRIRY